MDAVRKSGRQLGQYAVPVHREPSLELPRGYEFAELLDQPVLQSEPAELPWSADQTQPPAAILPKPVQALRDLDGWEKRESLGHGEPRATPADQARGAGKSVRLVAERERLELAAIVAGVQERGR